MVVFYYVDDFSCVKVTWVDMKDDDTDYINASYIDVCNNLNTYFVFSFMYMCVKECLVQLHMLIIE